VSGPSSSEITPRPNADAEPGPTYLPRLTAATATEQHGPHVAVTRVHRSDVAAVVVQRVAVGGRIVRHHHRDMWDHFVGLAGEGFVRAGLADGRTEFTIRPGAFLALPPATIHEVVNASEDEEFVFLLLQAPWADGDFITDAADGGRV
jgi:quercetin dioxygenase-like cupin family protein